MNIEDIFPIRFRALRKEIMHLTQKEMAELLDVPQPNISAYENGKNVPGADVLLKIANKCDISIDWLMGNSNLSFNISSIADLVNYQIAMIELEGMDNFKHFRSALDIIQNKNLLKMMDEVIELKEKYDAYMIDEEYYLQQLNKIRATYTDAIPLETRENLTKEEKLKKQMDYIQANLHK